MREHYEESNMESAGEGSSVYIFQLLNVHTVQS